MPGLRCGPRAAGVGALGYTIASNANLLRGLAPRLGAQAVERLIAETDLALERLGPLLNERAGQGFARHCHGDLHLGNILVEDGKPILFDCIEFNDSLSDIDIQYDLAFLLMDLDFRRRRDAAGRVLNAYLDEAARVFGEGLWTGLAALPLMLSVRAAVRTHVWAYSNDDEAARAYLATALEHLAPKPVSLVATGGLSGSGKSTFARVCAPGLGAAPGAVVLRTDEIRKRLCGVPSLQRLPKEAYTAEMSDRVYDELFRDARLTLAAGRSVVVDAVFLKPEQRARAEALAQSVDVAFQGVWLEAPPEVLRARVAARVSDASDADVAVLESQLARDTGEIAWRRVDTVSAFEDEARALAESMELGLLGLGRRALDGTRRSNELAGEDVRGGRPRGGVADTHAQDRRPSADRYGIELIAILAARARLLAIAVIAVPGGSTGLSLTE